MSLLMSVHLVGATLLVFAGVGIVFLMVRAHRAADTTAASAIMRAALAADILFTATALVVHPVTSALLTQRMGYAVTEGWVVVSVMVYLLGGAFWLAVVWLQVWMWRLAERADAERRPPPALFRRLSLVAAALSLPTMAAMLAILWLMVVQPSIPLW